MNVGMDELERLIKRYASTGAAVVIVILGPGQATGPDGQPASTAAPTTVTVQPPTGDPQVPTVTATVTPTTPPPAPRTVPPTDTRPSDRTGDTATGSVTVTPGPSASTGPTTTPDATSGVSAAQTQGWGAPTRVDEFDVGTDGWRLYDGAGHDGKGRRSPGAVTVQDGVLTIGGDASGTTGGMAWGNGRRYGRWEGRVRAPAADPSYDAVLLLWPDAENWPEGGEIDFMEMSDPARQVTDGFVHYGPDNRRARGSVRVDATQWHNWAVEWTPTSMTMFLDGKEWYRTTDAAVQPPGPMHLCVQLDFFPKGGTVAPSTMQVDWVREYALDAAAANGG
jgi:hypothetical protein